MRISTSKFCLSVLAGGITGIALVGMYSAIGQGGTIIGQQTLDGLRVGGQCDSKSWPEMKFTVSVENTEAKPRDVQLGAKLIQREFKGDPMSRVPRPGDTIDKTLEVQNLTCKVGAADRTTLIVSFKSKADVAERPDGSPRISYFLAIEHEGKPIAMVLSGPPAETARIARRGR